MISPHLFLTEDTVVCCKVREVPNLVSTLSQQEYLRQNGYANARAVGLPFGYTKDFGIKKIPNSLLIIPSHTIQQTNVNYERSKCLLPKDPQILKKEYSLITACIGGFCVKRKNYIEEYQKLGIPWVTGAWIYDKNALQRVRNLFSQFEFMTTNSIGSHIPYAMLCGCKVSLFGKSTDIKKSDYKKKFVYQKHPELIDIVFNENKRKNIQSRFPFLFSPNNIIKEPKDWTTDVLGLKNKIPFDKIAKLIGWKIRQNDLNSWEYIPGENPGLNKKH